MQYWHRRTRRGPNRCYSLRPRFSFTLKNTLGKQQKYFNLLCLCCFCQRLYCGLRSHVRVHELGNHVEHGALYRRADSHAVRHAWLQRAGFAGCGHVVHRLDGAAVELGARDVRADRDRTLVQVEHFLEFRAHDGGGQGQLSFLRIRILDLEHGDRIDVVGVRLGGAWSWCAQEVLAWLLAGSGEFALGPVAHELHAGLAVDDHCSRQVPVAARSVLVDVALDLAQRIEGLDHGRAGQGGRIELDQRLVVEVGAAYAQRNGFKHGRILPRLAALGNGDEAGFLDLVCSVEEFRPGGRHFGAGFFQDFRVDPEPVDAVHIDRRRYVMALVLHGVGNHFRQQRIPFACGSRGIDVRQHAFLAPFLDRRALDLGCCRRAACDDAGFQRGGGVFASAAGNRKVLPGHALGFHDLFQLGD
ncbi:conserved hypothetical protein [Collimonas fungivorans Ter331]|uniref:Uncharacterized protein n=1 Tax=Collimonas fungivorans (strain Ter331) TaxID=1005048 RepID=G0AJR0_COLFT|nr:conserved hypothetical protein [Collimonas fungivorans Ter331]